MLKTITFAILHFTVAFGIAYILTGSIGISSTVALVEPIVNTMVFYVHEKVWRRIESRRLASAPPTAVPQREGKPLFGCHH